MKAARQKAPPWLISLLTMLGISMLALASFLVYCRVSNDRAPDSIVGLAYAIAGLFFMGLAAVGYTLSRRSRKRAMGALNAALHWHVSLGIISLLLIFLHSFGNFKAPSGTYALYSLIALVFSGIIGRMLNRFVPKLIAHEVNKALSEQGDERVEVIMRTLRDLAIDHEQQSHSFESQLDLPTGEKDTQTALVSSTRTEAIALPASWDLTYISLEEMPQEIEHDAAHYHFGSDHKNSLSEPEALIPGLREHVAELYSAQRSLQYEQFYRATLRYWRVLHICLAILTIGLTLWHLEFATTLLLRGHFVLPKIFFNR